ncbi:MAG: HAD-IC family P-type ATPase [Deltaproteobacteria bacterium]|nr:HAD-IC family P-type ATPase [Deltaproteobacteria bacterium]
MKIIIQRNILPLLGILFLVFVSGTDSSEVPMIVGALIAGQILEIILNFVFEKQVLKIGGEKVKNLFSQTSKTEKFWWKWSFLTGWLILGAAFAIFRFTDLKTTAAILLVAAPFSLSLAVNLGLKVGISHLLALGLLPRSKDSFEKAGEVNVITFDKRGSLSTAQTQVQKMKTIDNFSHRDLLQYAVSIEQGSQHPFANAIRAKADEEKITPLKVSDVQIVAGKGVSGSIEIEGKLQKVCVGNLFWLFENDYDSTKLPSDLQWEADGSHDAVLWVGSDQKFLGVLSISDPLRAEAFATIESLAHNGYEIGVITGDAENPTKKLAKELKLKFFHFGVVGDEKATLVKRLGLPKKKGLDMVTDRVAFVGSADQEQKALEAAYFGIALGNSAEADLEVPSQDIRQIAKAFEVFQKTNGLIFQNLLISLLYLLVTLPLVGGALNIRFGVSIPLSLCACLVSIPQVLIFLNSIRALRSKVDVSN